MNRAASPNWRERSYVRRARVVGLLAVVAWLLVALWPAGAFAASWTITATESPGWSATADLGDPGTCGAAEGAAASFSGYDAGSFGGCSVAADGSVTWHATYNGGNLYHYTAVCSGCSAAPSPDPAASAVDMSQAEATNVVAWGVLAVVFGVGFIGGRLR